MKTTLLLFISIFFILCAPAHAHKPSEAFLTARIEGKEIRGFVELSLRDLEFLFGLDADTNGKITWAELRQQEQNILGFVGEGVSFGTDSGRCKTRFSRLLASRRADGGFAAAEVVSLCPDEAHSLRVKYTLFQDIDARHRAFLTLARDGESSQLILLTPSGNERIVSWEEQSELPRFLEFIREGVWHIWIGYDHILFLFALLLPAVAVRAGRAWRPVGSLRAAFLRLLAIVTAFTVAHSITLTAACLQIVTLPGRLVESLIAFSVAVAALNNVFVIFPERRAWLIAFGFGLLHGFGFASVLQELDLGAGSIAVPLVGFNIGVELGQLAIVAAIFPLVFAIRNSSFYLTGVLKGGSLAIVCIAAVWFMERACDLDMTAAVEAMLERRIASVGELP